MTPLDALNHHRCAAGVLPLVEDGYLVQLAAARAVQLSERYVHGEGLPASEVLTVGRLDGPGAVWEWLGWVQHRRILMDPLATRAGFGSHTRDGQTYWVGLIGG